jgi:hypothetical protein
LLLDDFTRIDMMRNRIRPIAQATSVGALLLAGTLALAVTELPAVQRSGKIEYLSGGIGKDEAAAIENASRQWPMTLEFAVKDRKHDEFAADVTVSVRDAKGNATLEATSKGPFLLAKLEPGHYTVDATFGGKTLHEKVAVKAGLPAKAVFVWPAGTEEHHS